MLKESMFCFFCDCRNVYSSTSLDHFYCSDRVGPIERLIHKTYHLFKHYPGLFMFLLFTP